MGEGAGERRLKSQLRSPNPSSSSYWKELKQFSVHPIPQVGQRRPGTERDRILENRGPNASPGGRANLGFIARGVSGSLTSGCHRLRQANSPGGTSLLPAPSPILLPPGPRPAASPSLPAPFPGAPGRTHTPSQPPCHRLAPTPLCWRSSRQLGVRRTSTPETRRPALPPRSPGLRPGPTTTPFSVRRGPSGPPALANWAPLRQPTSRAARSPSGKAAGKSLVYWAVAIPDWIRFPVSTVPFRPIPDAGGERVATS